MRSLLPLLFLVVAGSRLTAQGRAIAPAPSALFATPAPSSPVDTVPSHPRLSVLEGSVIGGIGGLLAGLALARVVEAKSPCACEDPGLDRAVSYGLSGLLFGAIIGGVMVGSD